MLVLSFQGRYMLSEVRGGPASRAPPSLVGRASDAVFDAPGPIVSRNPYQGVLFWTSSWMRRVSSVPLLAKTVRRSENVDRYLFNAICRRYRYHCGIVVLLVGQSAKKNKSTKLDPKYGTSARRYIFDFHTDRVSNSTMW